MITFVLSFIIGFILISYCIFSAKTSIKKMSYKANYKKLKQEYPNGYNKVVCGEVSSLSRFKAS